MKRSLCLRFFALSFLFIVLFLIHTSHAGAFGVSPPFINADRLVKGSRYETIVYLVQGQPIEDLRVKASFDVPEKTKSWFSVDKGEEFVIPKGVQQFPIKVAIKIPEDMELGIYRGFLRINTIPEKREGQQIAISVGARIDINLTVGEGVFQDFVIRRIDILDIEEGERPKITVVFENTGNVPAALSRATFDLYDKYGDVRIGFGQTEKLPEIPAFESKTFEIEFPLRVDLGIGEYWAEAKVYRDQTIVGNIKTVFNVTERKIFGILWKNEWNVPALTVGSLLVVAFVSWFLRYAIYKRKFMGNG